MKKKATLSAITVFITLFLFSCELEIYTFTAPDSAETESLITLNLTGRAIDNGDDASEYGIILQIPMEWAVVSGYVNLNCSWGDRQTMTEKALYESEYTPEPGYKIWVGTIFRTPNTYDCNISSAVTVLTQELPGALGDTENFTLKAAAGAFRNGEWVTDDPPGEFDFSNIVDDIHVESMELTKVEDVTAPAPVSELNVYDGTLSCAEIHIDWSDYDEASQGDVASYRIYQDDEPFWNVGGMEFVEEPAGTTHATVSGLFQGFYYFAVTAVDDVLNEDQAVTSVRINHQVSIEKFETGDFSWFPWSAGEGWAWEVTDADPHCGDYSAQSPVTDHGEIASLETTLTCTEGELSFWLAVDSEENQDILAFYVDDELRGQWSGSVDYTRTTHTISPGVHTFAWQYSKDASNSAGVDSAWLDDILFPLLDSDGDGIPDDFDNCPYDPFKIEPGICGCGEPDQDSDGDGALDCNDDCPDDSILIIGGAYYPDFDGDGFGSNYWFVMVLPCPRDGYVENNLDCDDYDAAVHPGAEEECSGKDNNCNGEIDEGIPRSDYYRDADGDGYGNPDESVPACISPPGYSPNQDDCNDADNREHPYQTWFKDMDGDNFTDGVTNTTSCTRPLEYKAASELNPSPLHDCDDANALVHPWANEICNARDDNCSGHIDEGCAPLEANYITIDGPFDIDDNSAAQYTCTAHYNDGSASDVTGSVIWTGNSCYVGVDAGGLLVSGFVPFSNYFEITADYGGKRASHSVWISKDSQNLDIRHVETNGQCSRDSLPSCRPCSGEIQRAFDLSIEGHFTEIKISGGIYPENILLDEDKLLKLTGVDDLYYPSASTSVEVHGSLTIAEGAVIMENIILGGH